MTMQLGEFLSLSEVDEVTGDLNQEVRGISYDSRKVGVGDIFFAVCGEKADGHEFIPDAVHRGAAAVVASRRAPCPQGAACVLVKDVRRTLGLWAAHFFGYPSARLKLVGVTGTNGKTTLSYLVESMLAAAGMEPGVIGTINYRYLGHQRPSHHTTPESVDLQVLCAEMCAAGVKSVAMEVSSHALVQERVRGLEFDVAVFTNLSRDHLDFHTDMDDYFSAKSRLFTDYLNVSSKPVKAAVIFGDDPRGQELMENIRGLDMELWSYGLTPEWNVHPVAVETDVAGLRGKIKARDRFVKFSSPLIGAANLQNILGAVGVGCALSLPDEAITAGIAKLRVVPGRLEKIENDLGITIVVDYAHTPDALEKVLGAVRSVTQGRVITVFGCGGDRDRGKRPLMGEIAARLSDFVVLTSDNPRTEEPLSILAEIEAGVQKTGLKKRLIAPENGSRVPKPAALVSGCAGEGGYCVEADRRRAIRSALRLSCRDDLVLIAGKGHEDYQIQGTERIHFDDREVASEEASRRASP